MSVPTLTPASKTSAIALPVTGTLSEAEKTTNYAFAIYANSTSALYDRNFVSGAVDQVAYTYKKLGGDVLDIELTQQNIYSAYEEAVLEYSYIVNVHQAKNSLPNMLGNTTASFDHDGLVSGNLTSGTNIELRYPKFRLGYAARIGDGFATEIGLDGYENVYSASFDVEDLRQDYDLQKVISASFSGDGAASDASSLSIGDRKINIKKVYYKTPHAMWRFYGYYGGLNSVGNLSTYGMYADDSTFEVIPPYQNKQQAMAYEDAIYTRNSHYSYELKNNRIRIHPTPRATLAGKMWVEFTIHKDAWQEDEDRKVGVEGINNMNTLPFANIPFKNINSIGKQWIRRFAIALSKEMLGQIRGKFSTIPIPGDNVTLNHSELLSQAKEEQDKLREELKTILDELTYNRMTVTQSETIKAANEVLTNGPLGIFVG
tara:strand:- start:4405 stop:5694 length:1290 start_codon:yes stop_codon:yes gene_type:complete